METSHTQQRDRGVLPPPLCTAAQLWHKAREHIVLPLQENWIANCLWFLGFWAEHSEGYSEREIKQESGWVGAVEGAPLNFWQITLKKNVGRGILTQILTLFSDLKDVPTVIQWRLQFIALCKISVIFCIIQFCFLSGQFQAYGPVTNALVQPYIKDLKLLCMRRVLHMIPWHFFSLEIRPYKLTFLVWNELILYWHYVTYFLLDQFLLLLLFQWALASPSFESCLCWSPVLFFLHVPCMCFIPICVC